MGGSAARPGVIPDRRRWCPEHRSDQVSVLVAGFARRFSFTPVVALMSHACGSAESCACIVSAVAGVEGIVVLSLRQKDAGLAAAGR